MYGYDHGFHKSAGAVRFCLSPLGLTMNEIEKEITAYRQQLEDRGWHIPKTLGRDRIRRMQILLHDFVNWLLSQNRKFHLIDGTLLTGDYVRLVVGAHGPYVEFGESSIRCELSVPYDQRWRINNMSSLMKYEHYVPAGREEKIYKQVNYVSYASYEPGLYYIDLFLTKEWKEFNEAMVKGN